ncbi:MAG: alpha/beta fold hydrolase [Gemmatimonadaceae bacterium]|nr:alpha/beta fold hydrolase [Gemmatimonadaceae bacterium]
MRWGKAASAGGAIGGALGAAALYNAAAARGASDMEGLSGGKPGELLWRGHRIAYTRHGEGRPVILLHGIHAGASSLEWRHAIGPLADQHTVFAVDLLGFGRSTRPTLRYTTSLLQAMLADVIAQLVDEPCAVVASSLTAAHLIALCARDPRHIAALALIGPTGVAQLREPPSTSQSATELLLETPLVGTAVYNALTSPASMRKYLELSYANRRLVTEPLVQSYVQSARQPEAKHTIGAIVGGRLNVDVRAPLRRIRKPMLLLWGEQARHNPVQHAHAFRVLVPGVEWVRVPNAGDLPHDEQPARVNDALLRFVARHLGGPGRAPRTEPRIVRPAGQPA